MINLQITKSVSVSHDLSTLCFNLDYSQQKIIRILVKAFKLNPNKEYETYIILGDKDHY
jgi:hypothetical protein